jgi:hypothetical protein
MEQLCTIGVCGLLGIVAVLAYYQKFLASTDPPVLATYLHRYVLYSGFSILALVVFRGVTLWFSVKRKTTVQLDDHHHHGEDCSHDHDHDHEIAEHEHHHDHDHEECHHHDHDHEGEHEHTHDHGHDHGHEHGWNPWRYIVLCLPIMLFFLGLPNGGFKSVKAMEVEESSRAITDKSGEAIIYLNFKELESWASDDLMRENFEGRIGRLKGQFVPKSQTSFGLVRFKMTCCAADAIPLNVVILSPEGFQDFKAMSWVQVTGQIQFRKRKDRNEYVPVLKLRTREDVTETGREEDL